MASMDRAAWLRERRASVEADYTRDASTYDDGYDPITVVHRRFVDRLIETTPEGGTLLDAPCGTGPYFGMILAAGRQVVGADQSAGMLERASVKHPDVRLEHVGLQELAFDGAFDAAMCIDAMEHVPPEEWPLVLTNLRQRDPARRAPVPDRRAGRSEPPGAGVRRGDHGRTSRRLR